MIAEVPPSPSDRIREELELVQYSLQYVQYEVGEVGGWMVSAHVFLCRIRRRGINSRVAATKTIDIVRQSYRTNG